MPPPAPKQDRSRATRARLLETTIRCLATHGWEASTVGFIAVVTAPPGRRMGHAGAVISGGRDTAEAKMEAMRRAGIHVAESPAALGSAMVRALKG